MAANTHPWLDRIRAIDNLDLQEHAPLAPMTSMRVGGPAECLAYPRTTDAVAELQSVASDQGVPLTILGGGTNVLVADSGIGGVVVNLRRGFDFIHETPRDDGTATWRVGAASSTARVVRLALDRGLAGPEVLAGVPGSIGGAVRMNAGGHEGSIEAVVESVQIARQGALQKLSHQQVGFAYRTTSLPAGAIILDTTFGLRPGDAEQLRELVRSLQARRRQTQPLKFPNAGSIFKNPPGDSAGRLIEAAGCKGWREGNAEVSTLHANFIINRGAARAEDVTRLASRIRRAVEQASSITLDLEIELLGNFDAEKRP